MNIQRKLKSYLIKIKIQLTFRIYFYLEYNNMFLNKYLLLLLHIQFYKVVHLMELAGKITFKF